MSVCKINTASRNMNYNSFQVSFPDEHKERGRFKEVMETFLGN